LSPAPEAYLDIETTGFQPSYNEITVVGIYIVNGAEERFVQLVGSKVSGETILQALQGVTSLYTYNGSRFDLPFIQVRHGVDLESKTSHCDLMYHCWKNNLYGGLKAVERSLGIERRIKEVDGLEAVQLWWRYVYYQDRTALQKLLDYNKEDVMNLKVLRDKLLGCSL
jgi:uncharacterized protein YprB with RNaseH-like and TPR domain